MRLPRGVASSLLSLAVGLSAMAVVAITWLPLLQYAQQQEQRVLSRHLLLTTNLAAAQFASPANVSSINIITEVSRVAEVDLVAYLPDDGPPQLLGTGKNPVEIAVTCAMESQLNTPTRLVLPDGEAEQGMAGACTVVVDAEGQRLGVLSVWRTTNGLQQHVQQQHKARNLLLLLGALTGLLVMAVMRFLLSPIQAISQAAAQIASGAHNVRVNVKGPEEIAQLARTVNAMADYLERREDEIGSRMAVVRQLASVVAHEVRNPLQSLSLLCTLSRTEPDPQKRDALLTSIHDEINALENVVQRFLRSSGPLRIRRHDGDLVKILGQAASVAQPRADKANVSMLIQAPGSVQMSIDGSLVRRAMENLMLNAIEFAGQNPPGHVSVSLLPHKDQYLFVVEDDGPGVLEHERERIFEQYYSSKAGGTGLGLTLVRRVFETHGGTIRCETSQLGGAKFVATLPTSGPLDT